MRFTGEEDRGFPDSLLRSSLDNSTDESHGAKLV